MKTLTERQIYINKINMHKIVKARNKLYNLRHAKNISKLFLYFF